MDDFILKIEDLSVIYKSDNLIFRAVNSIGLELKHQETLGLVGETGAGKTTTALSIMRLLPKRTGRITGGKILLDGENILTMNDAQIRAIRGSQISMIFQDPMTSLNPTITVGAQIKESLSIHNSEHLSKSELDKRVDELLELVGIQSRRKNEFPHQFSGGMRQRIVIAIALACEPKLLIADEPTTALDVTIQAQVLNMMEELKDKFNMSMIMITHDLGVVAETCEKVAIMYAGEIVEKGTAEDIFTSKSHHPYTDGLFGSIPNLKVYAKRLSPIDGLMPDPADLPAGCHFHPRCKYCMAICKQKKPKANINSDHTIACHLFNGES